MLDYPASYYTVLSSINYDADRLEFDLYLSKKLKPNRKAYESSLRYDLTLKGLKKGAYWAQLSIEN